MGFEVMKDRDFAMSLGDKSRWRGRVRCLGAPRVGPCEGVSRCFWFFEKNTSVRGIRTMTCSDTVSGITSDKNPNLLFDIDFDVLSEIDSDILSDILFDINSDILSDIYSDIVSDIDSDRLRSGGEHHHRELAVEVRVGPPKTRKLLNSDLASKKLTTPPT